MTYYDRLIIYFDGASRRNPHGPAGCGWELYEMDEYGTDAVRVAQGQNYLGYQVSNNQAEYEGLEAALRFMSSNDIRCDGLYIRGDSQIVINQLDGIYQVRSNNIKAYYNAVMKELANVDCGFVRYTHIPRFRNSDADNLANDAIEDECENSWWC